MIGLGRGLTGFLWSSHKPDGLAGYTDKDPGFFAYAQEALSGHRHEASPVLADLLAGLWRAAALDGCKPCEAEALVDTARAAGLGPGPLVDASFKLVRQLTVASARSGAAAAEVAAACDDGVRIAAAAAVAILGAFDRPPSSVEPSPPSPPAPDPDRPQDSAFTTDTVNSIVDGARHTNEEAEMASGSASMVVMNVRMVSGMMGEIARGMDDISSRVGQSQARANSARSESERTNQRITQLTDTVSQIASVARLIKEIAHHTNLLALNATIEAARAGEAGKGFAVVASEVKCLANQTAKATEDINNQLATIRDATGEVIRSVTIVGESFVSIHDLVDGIAGAVHDQYESFETIKSFTQEAADSVEEIAGTLDRISAFASTTAERGSALLERIPSGGPLQVGG